MFEDDKSSYPKKVKIEKKYVIGAIGVSTVILAGTAATVAMTKPTNIKTLTTNEAVLAPSATIQTNTASLSLIMVYKDGCRYCIEARDAVEKQLANHSDYPVQFVQINVYSNRGQELMNQFKAKGTPLFIVTNNNTHKSVAFNDGEPKGVKAFLDQELWGPLSKEAKN